MGITIELPAALRPFAQDSMVLLPNAECATVADALDALSSRCPGVVDRILDERGELRQHVNIFVDEESIRFLNGLQTPLQAESTITVIPAVSGG